MQTNFTHQQFYKTLVENRFREIAIRELKKAFPNDYPILEKEIEVLIKNRSLFEVKVQAQHLIAEVRHRNGSSRDI